MDKKKRYPYLRSFGQPIEANWTGSEVRIVCEGEINCDFGDE